MDPELFLAQEEVKPLVLALERFASKVEDPEERRNALIIAGLDPSFVEDIKSDTKPRAFAQALVAKFKGYCVTNIRLDYHPMVSLLQYLPDLYQNELGKDGVELFTKLVKRGQENFKAQVASGSVGRIESPKGEGIGTGVLVGKRLLLTCAHVFRNVKKAWVHFGYKSGCSGEETGEVFELDLNSLRSNDLDYALVTIKDQPKQHTADLFDGDTELNHNPRIRLIHHPLGKPVVISDVGHITQVRTNYISHDISADYGSSGAPIFNEDWQVVAIHKGAPDRDRSDISDTTRGEGIPIRAFWNKLSSHLSLDGQKSKEIEHALSLVREEQSSSRFQAQVTIAPIKVDISIIYYYNLVDLVGAFWRRLDQPEGTFSFVIEGDETLLNKYIIERMLREFENIIGERKYQTIKVTLYPKDLIAGRLQDASISGVKVIEHVLKVEKKGTRITDLFKNNSSLDVVLIIWCRDMLSEYMKDVTTSFCKEARTRVSRYLKNQGRRFVVIWADVDAERGKYPVEYPVDDFTILTLPKTFDKNHLSGSFKGQLSSVLDNQENVEDRVIRDKIIKDCLARLDRHDGRLLQTYEEMEKIVLELQKGYVLYG